MEANSQTLSYLKGNATEEELRDAVAEFFARVDSDDAIRARVERAGVSMDEVQEAGPTAVEISSEGGQFSGVETILIAVGIHIGEKLVDEVIIPWIKDRLSDDAVGERQS